MSHFDEYYEQQQSEIWESVIGPSYVFTYKYLISEIIKSLTNNNCNVRKTVDALEDGIFNQLKYKDYSWSFACHIIAREIDVSLQDFKRGSKEFNYLKETLSFIEIMKNDIPNVQIRKFFVYVFNEEDIMHYFEQINETSEKLHFIKELRVGLNSFHKNTDSYADEIKLMREFIVVLEEINIQNYKSEEKPPELDRNEDEEAKIETKLKPEKDLSPEKKEKRITIKINDKEIRKTIENALNPFIDDKWDVISLNQILNGETISNSIKIKQSASVIADLFASHKKLKNISISRTSDMIRWVCENIQYWDPDKYMFKEITQSAIDKHFYGNREAPKEKRIF